jgi:hypothetical protein
MSSVLLFSLRDYTDYTLAISLVGVSLAVSAVLSSVERQTWRILGCCIFTLAAFGVSYCAAYSPGGSNNYEGTNTLAKYSYYYEHSIEACVAKGESGDVYIVNGSSIGWVFGYQWGAIIIERESSAKTIFLPQMPAVKPDGILFQFKDNALTLVSCAKPKGTNQEG